jgi:hypothetical protein
MATTTYYDTTRGINTAGVPKMKEAVQKYQSAVDSACNDALSFKGYKKNITAAMRGTQTLKTLEKYMNSLKSTQGQLVGQLHGFVTALEGIDKKYSDQDKKFEFK